MGDALDRTLKAEDVFNTWSRYVRSATESTRVYTPYLDQALVDLLAASPLPVTALSVVTDVSPDTGALEYMAQLKAVRALIKKSVEVRSLTRLHAKVLVVDDKRLTVGSQNFTNYARESKEATALFETDIGTTIFGRILDEWYDDATPVPLELVEKLIEALEDADVAVVEARRELQTQFETIWDEHDRQQLEVIRQMMREQKRAASVVPAPTSAYVPVQRMAREVVWARLGDYESDYGVRRILMADSDATLTKWTVGDSTRSLRRLTMYPVLLGRSGRMAFARVAQTRISYVRFARNLNWHRVYGPNEIDITIALPADGTHERNIEVRFHPRGTRRGPAIAMDLLFRDGVVSVVRKELVHGKAAATDEQLGLLERTSELLEPTHYLNTLDTIRGLSREELALRQGTFNRTVDRVLDSFTYGTLGASNMNAGSFFPEGQLTVSLTEHDKNPVLIVTGLSDL